MSLRSYPSVSGWYYYLYYDLAIVLQRHLPPIHFSSSNVKTGSDSCLERDRQFNSREDREGWEQQQILNLSEGSILLRRNFNIELYCSRVEFDIACGVKVDKTYAISGWRQNSKNWSCLEACLTFQGYHKNLIIIKLASYFLLTIFKYSTDYIRWTKDFNFFTLVLGYLMASVFLLCKTYAVRLLYFQCYIEYV